MKGNYICLFKVLYNDPDGKNVEECGFCLADSFVDAVKYLEEKLYGQDLVEIHHMELLDTCPVLSKETWEQMRKELNAG
jgi:hypothetical protein